MACSNNYSPKHELCPPKPELCPPKQELYLPKQELYPPKPELCPSKQELYLPKQELYPMRKVTVEIFSMLDRDKCNMLCFLFNEPCEIGDLYRALEQHSKLNFKLIIESLRLCEFIMHADSIQDELDRHGEFMLEDETRYETAKGKLDKYGDTVLTYKLFEFRVKLIEIQTLLSGEELSQVKEHFGLNNNQKIDFPLFIDVVKLAERKIQDPFNPYKIVSMVQICLKDTLMKSGPILQKLEGFYDLHLKHEGLNNIGLGEPIGTIKMLAFLFNLDCRLVLDWVTLVSELKSNRVFNFHILVDFLKLCGEVADYASSFSFLEKDVSQQNMVKTTLSATCGDLCQRSLEFRNLLVSFSLSDKFKEKFEEIRDRFELPKEAADPCMSLLDVVLAARILEIKDLFLILLNALRFCGIFDPEIQELEEFELKNRELVELCSSTYN